MSQPFVTFIPMMTSDAVVDRFLYKSTAAPTRHRNRVETYLVERLKGSNVVARIQPLGLVPERASDVEAALAVLQHDLVVVGGWRVTARRHHTRAKLRPRQESSGVAQK